MGKGIWGMISAGSGKIQVPKINQTVSWTGFLLGSLLTQNRRNTFRGYKIEDGLIHEYIVALVSVSSTVRIIVTAEIYRFCFQECWKSATLFLDELRFQSSPVSTVS